MTVRKVPKKRSPYDNTVIGSAGFTIGAEATNAITVNVQLKDAAGAALAVRGSVWWYLSSDANGDVAAAAASGGVAGSTNGFVASAVTGKEGRATSEANGTLDFIITDTTVRTVYLNLIMPDGSIVTSSAIAFA